MEHSPPASDIKHTLGLDSATQRNRRLKRWVLLGGAVLGVLVAAGAWRMSTRTQGPQYKSQPATTGPLVVTVTATGTLQPMVQVDVGCEVSGTVRSYAADFNDRVKAGQVLVTLDTAKQEAQVLQSKATVASAEAHVQGAEATVGDARQKVERLRVLAASNAVAQQDVVSGEAAYQSALAQLAVARADAAKAKAALNSDEITLGKMVIRSPINGIVLRRNVEVGQTVAASLQAPVLYTLADDLHKMQISAAVDEADVGQVQKGQTARFTVDAYPNRNFAATVTEVRYAPQTVAGVVTYEALLNVNNSDLLLRPGMTATAEITVARLEDALLIPNAALRFAPPQQAENGSSRGGGFLSSLFARRPRTPPSRPTAPPKSGERTVWTLQGRKPVPVSITIGETDGRMTQVLSGDLQPGMPLLTDLAQKQP